MSLKRLVGGQRVHRLTPGYGASWRRALPTQARELGLAHAEAFGRRRDTVRPLPGAAELLATLTDEGVPWANATSGLAVSARPAPDRPPGRGARRGPAVGRYGREELERAGAYRMYADPAERLAHLDEIGVRRD
jgi:hypothetical protein